MKNVILGVVGPKEMKGCWSTTPSALHLLRLRCSIMFYSPPSVNCTVQMLKLIAKFVGKPKDLSELSFVTNPKAQKFMEELPEYPPADLRRRFPSAGADAVDLLSRMLVMRPDRRLSVDEALRHPYLRSLRDRKVGLFFEWRSR